MLDRVRWLYNRFAAMGPQEIGYRALEHARRRTSIVRTEGWARYGDDGPVPGLPILADLLLGVDDETRAAIGASAAATMAGQFEALGVRWPPRSPQALFPEEIWSLDPITGRSWPSGRYCFDIPYRANRNVGDVKYVWEFNRLQFLQGLAAEYRLSRDPAVLNGIAAAIDSWTRANPPFRGVHWAELLNVAMRAISLLVVASFCGDALPADTVRQLRSALRAHRFWLARFPSRHSSANNHLIAEVAAEFLITLALEPDRREPAAGLWSVLMAEVERQILPDGVPAEQSPTYGAFSIEFALLAVVAGAPMGHVVPPAVDQRLRSFAEFVNWIGDQHGLVPGICDNDEGRVLTLGAFEDRYPASIAAAVCGVLGFGSVRVATPYPTLRNVIFRSSRDRGVPPAGLHVFESGGLTVARERIAGRRCILTFDHGPLGYLSIAAHGHADALAITLSIDDRPILVDPGTYLYHSGGAWRNWFRGTRAHNTVTVAREDQSVIAGSFNWSSKARTSLAAVSPAPDWRVTASHDGYVKRFGIVHERTVERRETGYLIRDRLVGDRPQDVEIVFQLAPGCRAEIDGAAALISHRDEPVARICFPPTGLLTVGSGGDLGNGGWVSDRFGVKVPAPRLVWSGQMGADGMETSLTVLPGVDMGETSDNGELEREGGA